ncbi:MAG TPA: S41 family peptidase, partial [Candidatus Binatia bacterium]|nr:S41 family peptidase [Candidatus Binatia bacterium]
MLTIRHWYEYADPERKVTFLDFLKDSFAQIQTRKSQSLIIDVRDNDGGLDAPGKQLFAFLWDKPFYYDEKMVVNAREFDFFKYDSEAKPIRADLVEQQPNGRFYCVKHPNLGVQQPAQPHFAGKVFAIMNGGS